MAVDTKSEHEHDYQMFAFEREKDARGPVLIRVCRKCGQSASLLPNSLYHGWTAIDEPSDQR